MPTYQTDEMILVAPAESCVHPTAVLIGNITLDEGVYVGPNTDLHGDFGHIVVRNRANIQGNCVMHGLPGQDTVMEEGRYIGRGTTLYGCMIGYNMLIGMGAAVTDGAAIGEDNIVDASAFVEAHAEMPANHLVIGSPTKAVHMSAEQEMVQRKQGIREYQVLMGRCQQTLAEVEPLTAVGPDRKRLEFSENLQPKSTSQRFYAILDVRTGSRQ